MATRDPFDLRRLTGASQRSPFAIDGNRTHRNGRTCIAALMALGLVTSPFIAAADDQNADAALADAFGQGQAVAHTSSIDGNVLRNSAGLVRVNLTAGDGNVQQNSAAVAESDGVSVAGITADQHTDMVTSDSAQRLSVGITDDAFGNALGIVQVNQSAGAGNAQFNGAAIAVGDLGAFTLVELNDEQLMDQSSPTSGFAAGGVQPEQAIDVGLSVGAFSNASGIIQINQVAGNNNAAANSFAMSVGP